MSSPRAATGGALEAAVRELDAHAAESGWDQPARLFALVPTAGLVAREPALAGALGLTDAGAGDSLTPVEQEALDPDEPLESLLERISWPGEVTGCAAIVERLVLPPAADDQLPEDSAEALAFARAHPERQEVRIVAAAARGGATYCALRLRAHDDAGSVLTGRDLVPGLLDLLTGTLQEDGADE